MIFTEILRNIFLISEQRCYRLKYEIISIRGCLFLKTYISVTNVILVFWFVSHGLSPNLIHFTFFSVIYFQRVFYLIRFRVFFSLRFV